MSESIKHSFGGASWLVLLLFYFTMFILIVYSAETIGDNIGNASIDSYEDIFGRISLGEYYCDSPRYKIDPNTAERSEYVGSFSKSLKCLESRGVIDETTCNNIAGCTWENVTSGWWIFESTDDASCLGTIDALSYGVNVTLELGVNVTAEHSGTEDRTWYSFYPKDITPCNHPAVLESQTLCNTFSCTWSEYVPSTDKKSTIGEVTKELFTFSYNFNEDNDTLNFILHFIFIIIPAFMLVVAIYYILHPVK